jgi:CubicO group peptidase (beta-lactamase class C family)
MEHILKSAVEAEVVPFAIAARIAPEGIVDAACSGGAALDNILRIASMTKALTSTAVLQLVERGEVALDTAAERYLPRLRNRQVLTGFDSEGTPCLRDPASRPTVRQLLTHTAGFDYPIWNADLRRVEEHRWMDMSRRLSEEMLDLPMVSDPGTRWEYGINTDLLGALVEAVTGQSLERYLTEQVFDPLGMDDTGFNVPEGQQARVLPAYARTAEGLVKVMDGVPEVAFFSGGGGLVSTARDYARFLQAFLRGGELDGQRILEPETVDLMAQNHTGSLSIGPMLSANAFASADCDFFADRAKYWGLGFLVNAEDIPGLRRAGSLTWAGLFNTHFWIDRQAGLAGMLLTQLVPFCDPGFLRLYEDVERAIYQGA